MAPVGIEPPTLAVFTPPPVEPHPVRCPQVNEELMTGVSHTKAVTTIRRAKGLVQLVVSRPPDHHLSYLPITSDKCNGNAGRWGGPAAPTHAAVGCMVELRVDPGPYLDWDAQEYE